MDFYFFFKLDLINGETFILHWQDLNVFPIFYGLINFVSQFITKLNFIQLITSSCYILISVFRS